MRLDQPQKDLSLKIQVLLRPLDVLYSLQWVAAAGSQHVLSADNPGIHHPEVENYSIHKLRKAR